MSSYIDKRKERKMGKTRKPHCEDCTYDNEHGEHICFFGKHEPRDEVCSNWEWNGKEANWQKYWMVMVSPREHRQGEKDTSADAQELQ